MAEKNNEPIRDLSKTIITGTNMPIQTNLKLDEVGPGTSSQSKVNLNNAESSIKKLVDQGISSQMSEIRKTMADLTSTVSRLSIVVQQTQQENMRLLQTNLPNMSRSLADGQQPMETSGIQSSRASSINGEEQIRSFHRLPIEKWGLEFNGDPNKLAVEDFIFRLERLKRQYDVTWKEVLDNFHLLVKGSAEKWYWLFIQTNYVTEWPTLKLALQKQFMSTRSSFELMRDIVERKQQPGESIDSFFFAMTQLRSRLSISMPEAEMIKMIKKNLRESIGRIVFPMTVSSVEELRINCIDAEKTFLRKDNRAAQPPVNRYNRYVNEINEDYNEPHQTPEMEENEIAAVRITNTGNAINKPIIVCWNCRQNGHFFMDCPSNERAIFCYRCGKPDVISPNCINCRNKTNFRRNEGNAGDHRSSINPPANERE